MNLSARLEENVALRTIFRNIFRHTAYYLQRELEGCRTILDLGCGNDSLIERSDEFCSVGVDLSKDCLVEAKRKRSHEEYMLMDVRRLGFRPKCFDAVIVLDVLEHLEKTDGIHLLDELERIATRKVIVQTPNGFIPQMDENPLQVHRSGWNVDDFRRRGYLVRGMAGLRTLRGERAQLKFKPKVIWAIISGLSQKFTYYVPDFAWHLFCVKVLDKKHMAEMLERNTR